MRAALITDGLVVNLIEYDPESDYVPDDDVEMVTLENNTPVDRGWVYSNGTFNPASDPSLEPTEEQKRISALEAAVDQLILDQLMGG